MLTSPHEPLHPRKKLLYPMNNRLGGAQNQSGRFGEEKTLLVLLGFEPRTTQHIPQSLNRLSHSGSKYIKENLWGDYPFLGFGCSEFGCSRMFV
jgi:hypothetical protein